jgi:chromosome segregation ATPase
MPDLNDTNNALIELQKELENLKNATTLLATTREAASDAIRAAEKSVVAVVGLTDNTAKLTDRTADLVKKIEGIDFPSRLDKLDATVSSVNAGLQNTLSRLESVERNLSDRFQTSQREICNQTEMKLSEVEKAIRTSFDARFDSIEKRLLSLGDAIRKWTTINRYLLIGNIVLVVTLLLIQLFGK